MSGQPAATIADQFMVAGCVFVLPGGKPQPCIKAQWLVPAARVFINGQPAILQTSTGVCLSAEQAPQGAPMITASQIRVSGL